MAQFCRPDGDSSTGSWTNTPLWSKVDDDTGDSGSESDIITSDNNTNGDTCILTGTNVSSPSVFTTFFLRVRCRDTGGTHSVTLRYSLYQGTTLIGESTVVDPGTSFAEYTYNLTLSEATSITDYTDLEFRLSREGDTGGAPANRTAFEVAAIELEIPDAASATGQIKWYSGTAWVAKPMKHYNGTSWDTKPVKYRSAGGAWVTTTY